MATGAKNAKSQMTTVRIPHEVMEDIESLKEEGESTAGFLVTAAKGEIKRRQRKNRKTIPTSDQSGSQRQRSQRCLFLWAHRVCRL